jgi:polyisoprenoid-binding protein YceI
MFDTMLSRDMGKTLTTSVVQWTSYSIISSFQRRFSMNTVTPSRDVLPVGTWQGDPAHSSVTFELDYMTGRFRGSFAPFEATLTVDPETGISLRGSARAADVKVQDENLTAHLQTPDFFDVERTPQVSFESDRVELDGEHAAVAGTLTIRGSSQPVELEGTFSPPLTDPYGRERIGLRLDGTVDRTAFGIVWNAPLPTGEPALANEVRISAELYLVKA